MIITKQKHNKIVEQLQNKIEHLEKSVVEAQNLKNVFERITSLLEKNSKDCLTGDSLSFVTASGAGGWELNLPKTVPVYVDDYFGGKVIKQEATPVTILDDNGKAIYSQTARKPKKGMNYILVN